MTEQYEITTPIPVTKRKQLNIKSAIFIPDPDALAQQITQNKLQISEKQNFTKKNKISQEVRIEYTLGKKQEFSSEMKDFIQFTQVGKKTIQKQPSKIQKDKENEKTKKLSVEQLQSLKIDEVEQFEQIEQKKIKKARKINKQKQRNIRMETRIKFKRISMILYELRKNRGQIKIGQKRHDTNQKKQKLSKIKQSQQTYQQIYNSNLSDFVQQNKQNCSLLEQLNNEEYLKNSLEKQQSSDQSDSDDIDNLSEKEEQDQIIIGDSIQQNDNIVIQDDFAEIIFKMNNQNKYSLLTYNLMKIRCWVNHILSKEMDDEILQLINSLALAQAQKKIIDPKKFKKRIVAGFNEVIKTLTTIIPTKVSKLIIFPINLIENPLPHGTDSKVLQIIKLCFQKNIVFLNASNRKRLGWAFKGKFGPKISGQNDQYKKILDIHEKLIKEFQQIFDFDLQALIN